MKKLVCFVLSITCCLALISCSEKSTTTTESPLKEVNSVYDANGNLIQQTVYYEETNEYVTTTFVYEKHDGKWICTDQKLVVRNYQKVSTDGTNHSINIYYKSSLENGPIMLINNKDIKVSIVEYLDKASWWEFGYKFKVENTSGKTITIMFSDVSIMDINCDPMFHVDHIETGHSAYFNLAWDMASLKSAYIPYIDNIEFILRVYNNDTSYAPAIYGTRALIKHQ